MFSLYFILKTHIDEIKYNNYQKKLEKKFQRLDYYIQKMIIDYHSNCKTKEATICVYNIISDYEKLKIKYEESKYSGTARFYKKYLNDLATDLIVDINFARKEILTLKMKL